jgi:predicted TPR repeat methyltransferase
LPSVAPDGARLGDILDLGCGTGLMGATLHDLLGGRLVGVDLSARMLAEARAKQVYTELRCAEIGAALEADATGYDVILLADVLCYVGAIEPLFAAVRARLNPGGVVLVSIEAGEAGSGGTLQPNARYRHAPEYLRASLEGAGLLVRDFREETLRWESDLPVRGVIALATAPA